MNKYIRLIIVSAVLGLTSVISLAKASENVSQKDQLHLASSLAIYSYQGEVCANGRGCCSTYNDVRYQRVYHKHHHKKHHHKHHRKHYNKRHHKHHYKPKSSCDCQYS